MLSLTKSRLSGKTLFFIFILLSSFLYATIINVPADQPTIQTGIVFAANSDTVLVQPGTYVERINYFGKLITVGSLFLTTQDTSYISSTIINGNHGGTVVTFEYGEDSTAVICGFTIKYGYVLLGGGIYCNNYSSPILQNVTITGNSASGGGGGICCRYNSSPSLQNVTITGNSADGGGGGIYCDDYSNPTLHNVTITGNSTDGNGGGIYCDDYSSPSLQNVTISDNTASSEGGGIYCESHSNLSLENVTISDNSASDGGGIWCHSPNPILITNSILWNNSPQEIYISYGSVTATYSDIEGGWTGTGNIDSDPLFADPDNSIYYLLCNSPCIDAGDPASPIDPDSTIADMGAYYYHQYFGHVWHIATTGSDIWGNGSPQYPFATIQRGIICSAETDTVLVQPGTYVENINYNGKLITLGSLFLTTQDTSYISSTIIDGNSSGSVVIFNNSEDSTTVLCGFTITNGFTNAGGGIYCANNSNPSLVNVIITDNFTDFGGGIYCNYSSPSLQNVTITGNSAYSFGGGISCWDNSSPSLQNVTISSNSAVYGGGGVFCLNSVPVIINSILWNDTPQEIYISSGSVTATYSDIEGGFTGTGNIDSDPLFVNPGNGDFHLQSTSPCIDAGDPASPLDPDGTIADMGAYYFDQTITPDPPQNVTVEIIGTDVHLSWDAVTGANSYKVYSSDDPYTGFVEDTSGSFAGESWIAPIGDVKRFYYVIASTETQRDNITKSRFIGSNEKKKVIFKYPKATYRKFDQKKIEFQKKVKN